MSWTDALYIFLACIPLIVGITVFVVYYWWFEWRDYPKELRWP